MAIYWINPATGEALKRFTAATRAGQHLKKVVLELGAYGIKELTNITTVVIP